MSARRAAHLGDGQLLDEIRGLYDHLDPVPPGLAARVDAAIDAQPVEYTTTRYRCPFCGRSRSSRRPIAEHIGRCWKNPAVRACKTCRHHSQERAEPDVGLGGLEWCGAQDAELPGIVVHCPLWALRGEAS